MGGEGDGLGEAPEGRGICTHITDSLSCAAETNNVVRQLYPNLKKKIPEFPRALSQHMRRGEAA